jgi:hypothetical protein
MVMDKRYQVFVSSTFVDLEQERQKVLQTLMEMDCIPAGMELFPAADEEQWEFIQKVIDDCDYYLLIIGGKYGSVADDGLSYTEKEFDYAVSKGIKIIALIHKQPDLLPRNKTEIDQTKYEKLQTFIAKVGTKRLVRFWTESQQLPGEVALSLTKTIKMYPATGWVRANSTASPELLFEINELRKQNEILKTQQVQLSAEAASIDKEELEGLDCEFTLNGSYRRHAGSLYVDTINFKWSKTITWEALFSLVSPFLVANPKEGEVSSYLTKQLSGADFTEAGFGDLAVNEQDLFTIRIQLLALNLITVKDRTLGIEWSLTDLGTKMMVQSRTIKKPE